MEYDLSEPTWSKAVERYRQKGASEEEIDKYRQAWQKRQVSAVNPVMSRSKKRGA
jgi:hypothetical protein